MSFIYVHKIIMSAFKLKRNLTSNTYDADLAESIYHYLKKEGTTIATQGGMEAHDKISF